MCFIKGWKFCHCIPSSDDNGMEGYGVEPMRRSPVDRFGYKSKCCGCIPLKPAVIVIGIITLIWAAIQTQSADKVISNIISKKDSNLYYYSKLVYIVTSVLLMVSCGVLFLGMIMSKFNVIHIFVWYGFIFNCLAILLTITAFVLKIWRIEKKFLKHIIIVIASLSWNFLFFYFLVIVNSYKVTTLWS